MGEVSSDVLHWKKKRGSGRERAAYKDVESLATVGSGDLSDGRTTGVGLCVGTVLCREAR